MRKTILTLIFALATITFCNAQKIEMEKVFGGYTYTQNGNQMTMKDLVKTMESNKQAFDLIKKAQSNNTLSSSFNILPEGSLSFCELILFPLTIAS